MFRNDTAKVENLKKDFNEYWKAINTIGDEFNEKKVISIKRRIESTLSKVMSRTERVRATEKRDAMVVERKNALTLEPNDVNQYRHADAMFDVVGDTDPMQYWKSASYITQFMHGYKFDDRLKDLLNDETETDPDSFLKLLRANRANVLRRSDIEQWKKIDPGNAKIRDLMSEFFDCGWEKLLWVPPTVPYWRLEGPFKDMENQTKALLFSAWNVVPDVVSGLLSYEAERRMVQVTHFDHDLNYEGLSKQTATPLRLDGDPKSNEPPTVCTVVTLSRASEHSSTTSRKVRQESQDLGAITDCRTTGKSYPPQPLGKLIVDGNGLLSYSWILV